VLSDLNVAAFNEPEHHRGQWQLPSIARNYAARLGHWKFVGIGKNAPELYELASDVGEQHNLATEKPAVLAKLAAAVNLWDKETNAPVFSERLPEIGNAAKK
jgi:arylsulfatase A-like enzyme